MIIRELESTDLPGILELYTHLHDNPLPKVDEHMRSLWSEIIQNNNHHVVGGFVDGTLVSSCVIVIIPNLTHKQQPYALIENVITDEACRSKGYATSVLNFAKDIARKKNCYKIMLMTSSKEESTFALYEKAGYNQHDKTAFVQWL